jgi:penicillin-insensitive murein endopeptidase
MASPQGPRAGRSIGLPHRGVLVDAAELPREGPGFHWLRQDDRHFGLPRFVRALERAAGLVSKERPGGLLAVGDLSKRGGGQLLPHLSHRTGRDVDLLLYLTTLEGAPVRSPGFLHVGADGLAWDDARKRFLRFDVERTWLLVRALLEDREARVQWMFAHRTVEAMLLEWAIARGESSELIVRAMDVMLEPHPGGPHDDHLHVRTECTPAELLDGCERSGPTRAWIQVLDRSETASASQASDAELLEAILRPVSTARPAPPLSHASARGI